MSLIVGLQAKDGIVLAGDTRGTIGDPRGLTAISDVHKKIFRLTDHCAIGVSGSSEIGSALLDNFDNKLSRQRAIFIDDVAARTREHARQLYGSWFQKFPVKERPSLLLMIVGYPAERDKATKGKLYLLSSQMDYAPMLMTKGICMAGIPQYATYLANRFYDPNMSVESIIALAEYLIYETSTQDPKVGGKINIAIISPESGYRELTLDEIRTIRKRNEEQTINLKQFFFGEIPNEKTKNKKTK